MVKRYTFILALILSILCSTFCAFCRGTQSTLSESVRLLDGPINGVAIEKEGHRLVVYGAPGGEIEKADIVLFTHNRRDVVWAGRGLVRAGARAIVPEKERDSFTDPDAFWQAFTKLRYHDYGQQSTKVPILPIAVDRAVKEGDSVTWRGIDFHVIDTPGYTRGSISWLAEIDGLKYAFVGDLIHGDGKILDLYSLQDAIPEANLRGYHGWAARVAPLIQSLRNLKTRNPDILIPARGPVVRNPNQAIDLLIERLQSVYRNCLSISAGRWYFKENYDILAERVLGEKSNVPWMDWAERIDERLPAWAIPISNARLILSETGRGFLLDCGSRNIIHELKKLREEGRLKGIDGVFITHYHDDHTDAVPALLEEFPAPVYACPPLGDILIHPGAYRLPAVSENAIPTLRSVPDKHEMQWREFKLTFHDFPGQTIYHDALLVEKKGAEGVFFMGDSFTPSGIDDYCLLNRNIIQEGTGYLYCFDLLRGLPDGCLLNNQHVTQPFRFNPEQIDSMENTYRERKRLLADLFPWDEPNYGIDERWVRFYPYGQNARPGETTESAIVIFNHSAGARNYNIRLHAPEGIRVEPQEFTLTVPPRAEQKARFTLRAESEAQGLKTITADVSFGGVDLRRWTESIIKIVR